MGDVRVGKGKRTSIILVIIGISVVLFSLFSRLQVAAGAQEGPSVAGILLEGGSLDEKREVIQEEVLHWKQGSPIRLESDYETIYVDRSLFHFQIEETLAAFEEKTKRRLSNFFLKPTNVQVPLVVRVDENDEAIRDWPERINKEVMINKLIALASELQENEVEIVYQTEPSREMETTAEVTVSLPQLSETIVQSISENLNGKVKIRHSRIEGLEKENGGKGSLIIYAKDDILIERNNRFEDDPAPIKGFFYSKNNIEAYGNEANIRIEGGISAQKIILNGIRGRASILPFKAAQFIEFRYYEGWKEQAKRDSRLQIVYDKDIINNYSDLVPEKRVYNVVSPKILEKQY